VMATLIKWTFFLIKNKVSIAYNIGI
jgi:hypothetical protein